MPVSTTSTFFNNPYFLSILKLGVLLILGFYAIFALIIIRQVDLMGKTLITGTNFFLTLISVIHAVFVVGLIVLAYFML